VLCYRYSSELTGFKYATLQILICVLSTSFMSYKISSYYARFAPYVQ